MLWPFSQLSKCRERARCALPLCPNHSLCLRMWWAEETHVPICPNFNQNYNHGGRGVGRTLLLGDKSAKLSFREFCSETTCVEKGHISFPSGTSRLVAFLKTGVGKMWQKEGQKVLKVKPNTLKLFRKCQNM